MGEIIDTASVGLSWQGEVKCTPMDASLFFPDSPDFNEKAAKAICAECVVRNDCLEYALEHHTGFCEEIWGGTTGAERKVILKQRQSMHE